MANRGEGKKILLSATKVFYIMQSTGPNQRLFFLSVGILYFKKCNVGEIDKEINYYVFGN